jgi:flagellar motor switch protein FliN/FliY
MTTTPTQQTPADLSAPAERLSALYDVNMELTVEMGRTTKQLRDVLKLAPGEVVVLDRPAGAPADLYVNGALFARGQVVEAVESGEYAIRITEIVGGGATAS